MGTEYCIHISVNIDLYKIAKTHAKKRGLRKRCWGSVALKLKLTDIVECTRKEFLEYCSYKTVKQMKSQ